MNHALSDQNDKSFSLQYGALEQLLLNLQFGSQTSIASRFRKLRPKFALDNLLSKPGTRVSYDLSRVLSICAVYSLNSLSIGQADAVDMVISNWPEIARGFLSARRDLAASRQKNATPSEPIVRIYTDAFPLDGREAASWANSNDPSASMLPHLVLDCRPITAALYEFKIDKCAEITALDTAFCELDREFGWASLGESDVRVKSERVNIGLFGTGPYFQRARFLLAASGPQSVRNQELLQAYLDYLEAPPPIDSWKRFIGRSETELRLYQLLACHGLDLGLSSKSVAAETLRSAASSVSSTLALIADGERHQDRLDKAGLREPT